MNKFSSIGFFTKSLLVSGTISASCLLPLAALADTTLPTGVRLAPKAISISSEASLPEEVKAEEAAALKNAFDRDTTSATALYGDATITLTLDSGSQLSSIRLYNASQYRLSLSAGVAQGKNTNWTPVSSLQDVDLSSLGDGWNTLNFGSAIAADKVRLSFTLVDGVAGEGLSEVELWGAGNHIAVENVGAAALALGNSNSVGQLRLLSGSGNVKVSPSKPTAEVSFDNPYQPSDIKRAWLRYNLRGLHNWMAVRRAVNGHAAFGGYVAADEKNWSEQFDAISPEELVQGSNAITFGTLAGFEQDYQLHDAQLVVELDDGVGLAEGLAVVLDGDVATTTTVAINDVGDNVIEIPLNRRTAVGAVDLTFASAISGNVTIEALQDDGSWVVSNIENLAIEPGPQINVSGTAYTLLTNGVDADALRITITNAGSAALKLAEARVSGSPVGAARTPESLTINWPQDGEFYGRTGFIRGFSLPADNDDGPVEIYVAGLPFNSSQGEFEIAISKDQAGYIDDADDAPWSVDVVALYPNGKSDTRTITFNNPSYADGLSTYTPDVLSQTFKPGEEKTVSHEDAELTVTAGALESDTDIRISALTDIEVAKLDTGLVNVTKGPRRGYRMLPHMKFKANVKLKLPFSKNKIPQGYTENDVRLFYFDEEAGRWMMLDQSAADEATEMVSAETSHFTDFIAGVVVAPESPQVASYNPTQFKDMKAADPSAKVNLIEVPGATSNGDAGLSYPLELPPGRQGLAPQLALQYSSAGGNGWLGMGWNLPTQEVSIDTRWGVPRYSAENETETYLLNGQQLTPVAHRGELIPRENERVFHTRIEGGFAKIIRHGSSPANYWWEVTDKNGTRYAYGGDLDSGQKLSSAVLADDNGNTYRWELTEIRDTNGNNVRYSYVTVADNGLVLGDISGRQIYLDTIRYTGHDAVDGPFEVKFIRDRSQPGFTPRRDRIIDGRGGFKMVTADLLRRVEVSYNGALVRAYEFTFEEGAFYKQLLTKATQFDAANQAFNSHTFDYFDDARESGAYKGFASAANWNSPNDNIDLGPGIIAQDASALSGHEGSNFGWHLYVGVGLNDKKFSVGGKVGGNYGQTDGKLLLMDLNGDGLSDKVFINGSGAFMRANESGPDGEARFAAAPIQVADWNTLMNERRSMFSAGLELYFGITAGINWSNTVTTSDVYFTDANGDGLPDLNLKGTIWFNVLNDAGNPTFVLDSSLSAYPVGPASVDASTVQIDFDELYERLIDSAPLVDGVRAWTAPFSGAVQISGNVALLEDTSASRAAYETADGVRVAIQHNGTELLSLNIAEDDYAAKTLGVPVISVAKGDVIYFRVQSRFDGAFDQVSWSPVIEYTDIVASADANGLSNAVYSAASDFSAFSDKGGFFSSPFEGAVRVSATLNKVAQTTDDVTLELLMNGSVVQTQSMAWNQTGPLSIQFDTPVKKAVFDENTGDVVQEPDVLQMRLVTDSKIDLAALEWSQSDQPRVWYIASSDDGLPNVLDENGNPAVEQSIAPSTTIYSQSNLTTPLAAWTATETGTVTVDPSVVIAGGNLTTDITLTVKSNGALIAKSTIPVVNGVATVSSFDFTATTGQAYFFEFASDTSDVLASISASSVSLTLPSTTVVAVDSAFYGAMADNLLAEPYRGWNTFGYNGNRERADLPISITASDLSVPTQAEIDALKQQIEDAINAGEPNDALVNSIRRNLYPFGPVQTDTTPVVTRWESGDDNLWTEALVMSSSRFGADFISVPDASTFAGAQAVPRISSTDEFGIMGGVLFASASGSTSSTVSILDFLDMNGDRFPDVVRESSMVQYSPMIGGLEPSALNVVNMNGDVRETTGSSTSFGIGGNFPHQNANSAGHIDVTGSGGSTGNTGMQMSPLGFSANFGGGDSEVQYDLMDLNADGLPDLVAINGANLRVRLNLGYKFAGEETYGANTTINKGESSSTSIGLGFNDGAFGWAGGLNGSTSSSKSIATLLDVNGDGLPDAVMEGSTSNTLRVRLNSGSGFESEIAWSTGGQGTLPSSSAAISGGGGVYFQTNFFFLIINPGIDGGVSMNRLENSVQDINGDGYPDFLHSEDDDELVASFGTTERTNMLKTISRPLGSTITLAYQRSGNTSDQPQSKWVLKRVETFDGFAGDGTDVMATNFTYEDGYWDRQEREFYGYATVTEDHMDTSVAGAESVYRSVTREFLNSTYYNKGLLARSTTADAQGNLYVETVNTYRFIDIDTGIEVADAKSLTATVFPQLLRTDNRFYEGQAAAGKATYQTFVYDEYGNVTRFFDAANLNTPADDVESLIAYHEDLSAYIVGKAETVTVSGNGQVMRQRQAVFQTGTGNMVQLRSLLADGSGAVNDFVYDTYGNLVTVTGPANAKGQRYELDYVYDNEVATYVTDVTDSFGYHSQSSYDVRFGSVLTTVDLNNQPTTYTLDDKGRIVTVTGPYQAGTQYATITFAYHPKLDVVGDTQFEDVAVSWADTQHIDVYRNISDPIETSLFIDGLGRVLQTKKDASIYSGNQSHDAMVASGRVTFDFVGRQTEQYYPVEEALGAPGSFNFAYDTVAPTITDYDVMDRPVAVTIPDGSVTTMAYDFGTDRDGVLQFHTTVTDAENNSRETFADVRQLTVGVIEHNPIAGQPTIWTSYAYDPLKQIVAVKDDKSNITTAEYDNFGRMVALDSPDAGRTAFTFDLASNMVAKQTANLVAEGKSIAYDYDYTRLASVTYPDFAENNVTYTYGEPGAAFNRANRIVTVTSEAGTEERFYGPLGEMVKQIRTVNSDTQGNSVNSPEVWTTNWTYDTWNRLHEMTYPDGEVLTNQYDSGGNLRQIDGVKGSFDYAYLRHMGYDKFGQRVYLQAGNGTETSYSYVPTTRRLDALNAQSLNTGRTFQSLTYAYDRVGNITAQANSATVNGANQLGGATSFTYEYDNLYRLTKATGAWNYQPNKSESFTLDMGYDTIHNIVSKNQAHIRTQPGGTAIPQKKTSYDWAYTYGASQPHAASLIGERAFSYDANGNQTGWDHTQNGTRRTITWDEENRIQAVADNGHVKTYKYDDAGERVIKRGPQGETAYINQFFTMRNREVGTKHVFAGSTRLASKLVKMPRDANNDGIEDDIANCSAEPWGWTNGNGNGGANGNAGGNGNGNNQCKTNNGNGNNATSADVYEKDQYYFHPDHLGSSSYVTDADGEIFQHLEYFPFGETFVEEHSNTQRTPYLFTAKELDEETGLYYFGARYYDPRTSVWQSPDPILESYMSGSPSGGVYSPPNLNMYGYVHQRPVVAHDPEGEWINFLVGGIKAAVENAIIQNAEIALGVRDEFSWGDLAVDTAIGTVTSGASTVKNAGRIANVARKVATKADDAKSAGKLAKKSAAEIEKAVESKKTYQTYTKTNKKTGEVYCGRTSGCGAPLENVRKRDQNHHMNEKGFGPARLDKTSSNKDAIRGREQQLIDANGGARSQGGTSGNAINGISESNPKRPFYLNEASKEFGN